MEHISVAVSICQYLLCDMKLINCHAHQTLDVLAFFALDWLQSNFLTFSRLETLRGGRKYMVGDNLLIEGRLLLDT